MNVDRICETVANATWWGHIKPRLNQCLLCSQSLSFVLHFTNSVCCTKFSHSHIYGQLTAMSNNMNIYWFALDFSFNLLFMQVFYHWGSWLSVIFGPEICDCCFQLVNFRVVRNGHLSFVCVHTEMWEVLHNVHGQHSMFAVSLIFKLRHS